MQLKKLIRIVVASLLVVCFAVVSDDAGNGC